jgi:hypothetical protein
VTAATLTKVELAVVMARSQPMRSTAFFLKASRK